MAAKADHPGAAGLTTEELNAIIALYAAFERGDGALLDQAISEGWQDIPLTPGQALGRDGMKPVIAAFHASFSHLKVIVHEVIGAAGRAGVRAEIRGQHTGEWFGRPATGATFAIPLHEFHHLDEGRITHTWHLEDWFGWLNQIGAEHPPQNT